MPASATADSLARSVPRSTMDQLRNDSQRKAESTSAHRVALGQQQELEPEPLEQQLKGNEACGYERGPTGVLSQAMGGSAMSPRYTGCRYAMISAIYALVSFSGRPDAAIARRAR